MEMTTSKPRISRPAALLTALLLGACAGPALQPLERSPSDASVSSLTGARTLANRLRTGLPSLTKVNVDHRPSWIGPDVRRRTPHLWIADIEKGDVDIFTFPKLRLIGTLRGFSEPQGLCADTQSNVWIVDTAHKKIYEYSRSGSLLKTINDDLGYPASCAINPRDGDLAITNIWGSVNPYEPGNLIIYKHATGTPETYTLKNLFGYYFVGYDRKGDLFLDGCDTGPCQDGGTFAFAELPNHGTALQPVQIVGGTIYFGGFIDGYSEGDDLLVGDQACGGAITTCVYQVAVAGFVGTIKTSTSLHNATGGLACDVNYAVLTRSNASLAGGDAEFSASQCPSYTASGTYRWKFPAGGNAVDSNLKEGQKYPAGVAITY